MEQALRRLVRPVTICLANWLLVETVAQAAVDWNDIKRGVAMVRGRRKGAGVSGAGVLLGYRDRQLYIATADHVLRGDTATSELQVKLSWWPGEWFDARALDSRDQELDLGLIVVDLPEDRSWPTANAFARVTSAQTLKEGDEVFPIGYPEGREWGRPAAPDHVSELGPSRVFFQSTYTRRGNSGGGLFDACGRLRAMVRSIESVDAEAVRIDAILLKVRKWGIPVSAAEASGPCGTQTASAPAPCVLDIQSNPPGADVTVDGVAKGTTPTRVTVEPGKPHVVALEKDGYKGYRADADCSAPKISARLTKTEGTVHLQYAGDTYRCNLQIAVTIGGRTVKPTGTRYRVSRVDLTDSTWEISGEIGCPGIGVCTVSGSGELTLRDGATYKVVWRNVAYGVCDIELTDE